ncbi:amino acid adenylation domain-containing protein [Acidomonas methanolica]|uniref:amino acid adenylation domain-containing protein n=1 Tax=Acidomonas methanolica TaxID=437 RepID=UPI002119B8FB|nr:amino acid adenylation domain-containing protein [Acidomonas methanolica]
MSLQRLPLTTAQRGVWMGGLLRAQGGTFNIAEAIELRGPIEPDLFRAALAQVSQEAETTRIRIGLDMDGPYQDVLPELRFDPPFLDFSTHPAAEESARTWMTAHLRRPVDLACDPLWYSALIKLEASRFIWFHCCHHIALDGFSAGLIVARVAELYTARAEGRDAPPASFLPLRTLIEQEERYRAGARRETDRLYWRERLALPPEAVTLASPSSPPRPADPLLQALGFVSRTAAFDERLKERIRAAAQDHGATLPQMFTALLVSYIFRCTGQEDLTIGMPVTGRLDRTMRRVPGMAANAVVLRFAPGAGLPFPDLLAQTRRAMHGALRHQNFRYEDLRRELGFTEMERHLSRIAVNIEPFDYHLSFGGHSARNVNLSNGMMEDLTIFVFDRQDGEGISLALYANPALYDAPALDRHLARIQLHVEAILDDPGLPLGAYPFFSPAERAEILRLGGKAALTEKEVGLLDALARHALRRPESIAVSDSYGNVTYRMLYDLAGRCAETLAWQGVGPGTLVAIRVPRDRRQIVAMLAVALCGAAWLSLDPDGPPGRTAAILDDARPALILTGEETFAVGLPHQLARLPLAPDGTAGVVTGIPAGIGTPQLPINSAYVIYTSGTTGTPKGVIVPKFALENLLRAMQDELAFGPGERWLSATSVTFDISILEFLLPLRAGARLVLPEGDMADPRVIAAAARRHDITIMQATPTWWRMALNGTEGDWLRPLRVLCGGEALSAELARALMERARAVFNVYGPTETTIWSTLKELHASDAERDGVVPVGRPLAATRLRILDRTGGLLPFDVPGQLAIGGAGVASGYLRRPDLTGARFVPDLFDDSSERLYLTGDRALLRPDGTLVILGREDEQIKIRGVRAEPAEIESALRRQRGVAMAAIRLWPRTHGPVLTGYIVPEAGESGDALDIATLREGLLALLPAQMVPTRYVFLDALPLTPAGKLDRKSLPPPSETGPESAETGLDAQDEALTPEESLVAGLWRSVLGRAEIGRHDNFFDLGGDSLSAVQFVMALEEKGYALPITALFGAPTIARLARLLHHKPAIFDLLTATVLPLRAEGDGPAVFCFHPVLGLSLSFATLLPFIPPSRPVYGLQDVALLEGEDAPRSIAELAAHYLKEIRALQPDGPYTLIGWSMGGLVAHALAGQLLASGERVASLILLDSYPLRGPDGGPLDDPALIEAAIGFLDVALPEDVPPPRTLDALADRLVETMLDHGQALPSEFGEQGPLLARLRHAATRNLDLLRGWTPHPVACDAHFFRAARRGAGMRDDPSIWTAFLDGRLDVTELDCTHQDMLDPAMARRLCTGLGIAVQSDSRVAVREEPTV